MNLKPYSFLLCILLAGSLANGEDFYWSGNSSSVTSQNSWTGSVPDLYNSQAENDIWNFDVTGTDPNVNQPNIRLAGMKFGANSGSYTVKGNNPLNFYGFTEGGTRYMLRNDSGLDQTFNNNEVNLYNDLTIDTNAQITFQKHVNFRTSQQQLTVTGTGGITFDSNANVNINSTKFHFANSGTNTVKKHFNSLRELHLSGGGTTTFEQSVTVNNTTTIIENCFTTGIFKDTFNSDKLLVKNGGTAVFTGNNQKNFNQGIELRGGTLLLEKNHIVGENKLNMNGGQLLLNNTSQRLESLTLSANSSLDFGTASGFNEIKFNDVTPNNWDSSSFLTVLGYQYGVDEFEMKTINATQLSQIQFYGNYGAQGEGYYGAVKTLASSGDFYYITPGSFVRYGSLDGINNVPHCGISPVPEPATVGVGGLIGLGALLHLWRRWKSKRAAAVDALA